MDVWGDVVLGLGLGLGLGFVWGLGFVVVWFFGFFGDGEATRSFEYCDKFKLVKLVLLLLLSLGFGLEIVLLC